MPVKGSPDAERHRVCLRCKKWFEPDEGSMVRGERWRPLDWPRAMVNVPTAQTDAFMCNHCQRIRAATKIAVWIAFLVVAAAAIFVGWLRDGAL